MEIRRTARKRAEQEYAEAVFRRDYSRAWSKAVMTGRVTGEILEDSKRLLSLMGVPWLDALEDAEAQASSMAAKGTVWAVGGKDYDSLLYGAPTLARYLTITGREYLPAQKKVRRLVPELIGLQKNLAALGITREQLVDVAILIGTDFNEGVEGFGPKKALSLIKKYASIEDTPMDIKALAPANLEQVREVFLKPRVREVDQQKQAVPDVDGLVEFLSKERGFSRERVVKVANGLVKATESQDTGLTEWLQ